MMGRFLRISVSALVLVGIVYYVMSAGGMFRPKEKVKPLSIRPRMTLKLFMFAEYIDPAVYNDFLMETGIKVEESNYGSNEEMLEKLDAGEKYDIIQPSSFFVPKLIQRGIIAPLTHKNIPNIANLDPRLRLSEFDIGNRYCIPLMWGSIGLCYNNKFFSDIPLSWSAILEADRIEPMSGRVVMVDDMRAAIGTALIYLGHSPNTTKPEEIAKAGELLMRQRPFLSGYKATDIVNPLIQGDIFMAQTYSGTAAVAMKDNKNLRYTLPGEGTVFFLDCFAIPSNAPNKVEAEMFLNYLLRPDVSAKITNYSAFANGNVASRPLVNRKFLKGAPYFSPITSRDFHVIVDVGPSVKLYEDIWDRLQNMSESGLAVPVPAFQQ